VEPQRSCDLRRVKILNPRALDSSDRILFAAWIYCHVSGDPWLIITASGLNGWVYWRLYIYTVRDYRQYSAIAILHTFQFTVTHALGFSVLTSRVLATELSQCHCNFKSHVKSSWHRPIPFFPFLWMPIRNSTRLLLYAPLYSAYYYYSCPAEHFF
jgi:hypothetical protein